MCRPCLLVLSDLWRFVILSLYFMTLKYLRNAAQVFCRMSLNLGLSDVLSWLDWVARFWGRSLQTWRLFFISSCQGIHDIIMILLVILELIMWLEMCLLGFWHKISIFHFLSSVLWKSVSKPTPTLKEKEIKPNLLENRCHYLRKSSVNKSFLLCLIFNLFIYLCILLWTHHCLLYWNNPLLLLFTLLFRLFQLWQLEGSFRWTTLFFWILLVENSV